MMELILALMATDFHGLVKIVSFSSMCKMNSLQPMQPQQALQSVMFAAMHVLVVSRTAMTQAR